jgi:hypothetical protein
MKVVSVVTQFEDLSRELTLAARILRANGPGVDIPNARALHSQACELRRQKTASDIEELWVKASIVYQLTLADKGLEWPVLSEMVPLSPYKDERKFYPSKRPEVARLYHLFLANTAIIGTITRKPTWERVATFLASEAVRYFANPPLPRTRWYGAILLVPVYWDFLSNSGNTQEFKDCASAVLRLLRNDPTIELCVFARYLMGDPNAKIVEQKGRLRKKTYREPFFSLDDLFVFND